MNLTYVVRAGICLVWRLLRLTGLHNERDPFRTCEIRQTIVRRPFILEVGDKQLIRTRETVSAPCYTTLELPAKWHYLFDASIDAVGGYGIERKFVLEIQPTPPELTIEHKEKAERREIRVTINLLDLWEMVVAAWVILELTGDRSVSVGAPIAIRGDNMVAVTWVNKCGGAKYKKASLLTRMLGHLEINGGWSHVAKSTLGVKNNLAGGISR